MNDRCLGCDATEPYCIEVGGCCDSCDHRPDIDPTMPDDVALPGLEQDEEQQWTKTRRGYLAHLAQLDYGDSWRFWSVCTSDWVENVRTLRGQEYSAADVESVFLTRRGNVRRALIVIHTGEVLVWVDLDGQTR
jgi:hypothetical protein